jgi:hypothetical protein
MQANHPKTSQTTPNQTRTASNSRHLRFELFRAVPACFGLFWPVLACSGLFRPVSGCSGLVWAGLRWFAKVADKSWLAEDVQRPFRTGLVFRPDPAPSMTGGR